MLDNRSTIAAIIPCYRVKAQILGVIDGLGPEVARIYVVDDACPDRSGDFVQARCQDPRVQVLRHPVNLGVGGAVMTGYRAGIRDGCDILVKIDGDGQMDGGLLPRFVQPIIEGLADYTKGNRFYDLESLDSMPRLRLFGNAMLSFAAKFSSGYWNIFDPTNGYTAIHRDVAGRLNLDKLSKRYFFETDILFRLNTLRAVVVEVPMEACYRNEISSLRISHILPEFLVKHARNSIKRIFYNYYLRDMSIASVELPLGILMAVFGTGIGLYHWYGSSTAGVASAGTVMLSGLPVIVGIQLLLAFLNYDIGSVPTRTFRGGTRLGALPSYDPSEGPGVAHSDADEQVRSGSRSVHALIPKDSAGGEREEMA